MDNFLDKTIGTFDKIVILGFYNRKNTGDNAYIECFDFLLREFSNKEYYCMDDINEIPNDTTIVVCGGGDIINAYFMEKARRLLANFTGHVYAISVGIPYPEDAKYLTMFDHVVVRSQKDYEIASNAIGDMNVDVCADITHLMNIWRATPVYRKNKRVYALCLAQPVFKAYPHIFEDVVTVLRQVVALHNDIEIHLLPFNYNEQNPYECDVLLNDQLKQAVPDLIIPKLSEYTPWTLLNYINEKVDVCICMRYHSLMFSIISRTPCVTFHNSPKITKLSDDVSLPCNQMIRIDEQGRFDTTSLLNAFNSEVPHRSVNLPDYTHASIITKVIREKKTKYILIKNTHDTVENTVQKCINSLSKYFHIPLVESENMINKKGLFENPDDSKSIIDIARFICYTITWNTDNQCLWGLVNDMTGNTSFCLRDAIVYIFKDTYEPKQPSTSSQTYIPHISLPKRRSLAHIDSFLKNNFSAYHRAGWAYCIAGMQHIDATTLGRDVDLFVDTYVDRTFHWGYDTMKAIGAVPYTKPWYGFIHHTFDNTHSNYNNEELFQNMDFLISLCSCKGLVVLSKYLADQVSSRLDALSLNVPVHVLYHPTEFVTETFDFQKFVDQKGGVVQIGAWLRKPYSIYSLRSPMLSKKALRGKEMDLYFAPRDYLSRIEVLRYTDRTEHDATSDKKHSPLSICRCFNNENKFLKGAVDMLTDQVNSVEVINKLSNPEYDALLATNIVFLDMVDCSAVNTIVECIVRNTPVIVSKHPALVEILGEYYPGFYTNHGEAESILCNLSAIQNIHLYLSALNKERFTIDFFLEEFQNIITNGQRNETYQTYQLHKMQNVSYLGRLSGSINVAKFLPLSFTKLLCFSPKMQ